MAMPCVRIATGKWAVGQEMKLIEAVQSALVSAFKIPEGDRDVVLDLYDDNRRIVAAGRSERYTRVEIIGIAARSLEAKRALFKTIADKLESVGVPRNETRIFLIEPPPTSWGIKGGVLASEADLGFKIDV
jgi:phenylpyruvate tautomerase PptA (4-oxalocrotonate tautomerase family)